MKHRILRPGVFLALLFATGSTSLHAMTYTVTSLNDNGPNTLRSFMMIAVNGDTINFDPSIQGGTITLQSSLPTIANSITIAGGTGITINEANLYVAFDVTAPGTTTISTMLISSPLNPVDTQVSANSTFEVTSHSQLANLDTSGTLTVDNSTLNTLDTTGTTTLQNHAIVTGMTTVEVGGTLMATSSTLDSLLINGTATLIDTPTSGPITVGPTGTFTGSGIGTIIPSLVSSGTSTFQSNAILVGTLSVLAGTTTLQSSALVMHSTTVSAEAALTVNNAIIGTLDTFGNTMINNDALLISAMIEPSGTLSGIGVVLESSTIKVPFPRESTAQERSSMAFSSKKVMVRLNRWSHPPQPDLATPRWQRN